MCVQIWYYNVECFDLIFVFLLFFLKFCQFLCNRLTLFDISSCISILVADNLGRFGLFLFGLFLFLISLKLLIRYLLWKSRNVISTIITNTLMRQTTILLFWFDHWSNFWSISSEKFINYTYIIVLIFKFVCLVLVLKFVFKLLNFCLLTIYYFVFLIIIFFVNFKMFL